MNDSTELEINRIYRLAVIILEDHYYSRLLSDLKNARSRRITGDGLRVVNGVLRLPETLHSGCTILKQGDLDLARNMAFELRSYLGMGDLTYTPEDDGFFIVDGCYGSNQ